MTFSSKLQIRFINLYNYIRWIDKNTNLRWCLGCFGSFTVWWWLSIVTLTSGNYAGLDLTKPWERSVQAGTVLWWVMGGSSQWFSVNSWLTGVFCTAKTFIFSELTSYKNDHSIFEQSLPEWMEEKCSGSVCLLRKQSLIFHLIYLVLSRTFLIVSHS